MTKTVVSNPYSVKNIKTFTGREGHGFECSLYRDGKSIGKVVDVANGGSINFYLNKEEIERLDKYCSANLGQETFSDGISVDVDKDMFVCRLVDELMNMKQYKRWCKKQTVFCIDGDQEGKFRTINKIFDDKVKAYLVKTYPDCGLRIINEEI